MGSRVITPHEQSWETRPHADGEPARHVTELSEVGGMEHVRANVWRYEPGAAGRRHRHPTQEETFVVLTGTLSIYLGEPPERRDVPAGSLVHVRLSHKVRRSAPLREVDSNEPFSGLARKLRDKSVAAKRALQRRGRYMRQPHVKAGTPLQSVNHGDGDLIVYAHGWPPEEHHAELLASAVRSRP